MSAKLYRLGEPDMVDRFVGAGEAVSVNEKYFLSRYLSVWVEKFEGLRKSLEEGWWGSRMTSYLHISGLYV